MCTTQKSNRRARLLAFYLPQFHPIPENDAWWGPGYTDWIAVAQARPLFRGHMQPNLPGELGFYDLRLSETRQAQAQLASQYGIEGFCYWHYWFGGKRLLEQPFESVLSSGVPDLPFCLAWANHDWESKWWYGVRGKKLIDQCYPGMGDHEKHFDYLLRAFTDHRYVTVHGRPLFFIYRPHEIPDVRRVTDFWRELAYQRGLKGLHLVGLGLSKEDCQQFGFDASVDDRLFELRRLRWEYRILREYTFTYPVRKLLHRPLVIPYEKAVRYLLPEGPVAGHIYPSIYPNWDNSPRARLMAIVLHNSNPRLFEEHLRDAVKKVKHKDLEERIIFVRSWNEWGEGNYLEPDRRFGRDYLEVVRKIVCSS